VSVSEPITAAPPPRRASTKTIVIAIVVVILTFVSGAAAGVLLAHLHVFGRGRAGRPPRIAPALMVRHLDHALDLTPEQRTKVEEIVRRHHQRIEALTESVRPQVRQELEAANREIEALLTSAQRQKFEKMKLRLGHREGRSRRGPTR
jgi:hypothetical protein